MSGLFAQVSTLPPEYLTHLAAHLQLHPEIRQLALTDVRPWDWPAIDGTGLHRETETVFVGAPNVAWYGPRSDTPTDLQPWMIPVAGAAGMLTPSYRWDQIAADIECLRFASPRDCNLYVGQEVGIDALGDHPRLRQAWEAYLVELCRQAYAVIPWVEILWSPYAWDLWSAVSPYRRGRVAAAVRTLISNVKTYSGTSGVTIVDLQDSRGAQPAEPETDAVNWYRLIKGCGAEVRINAEWFTADLQPQDKEVMAARLAYYAAQGVPVGCCWEARYWGRFGWVSNHQEPVRS